MRPVARVVLLLLALLAAPSVWAADAVTEARQAWQLLEYIAVDYGGAVDARGGVADAGEYAEMQEFAATIGQKLAALPAAPGQAERIAGAGQLQRLVAKRAAPAAVATAAHTLARQVLAAYPIDAVPGSTPDRARGAALYAAQCSACHGATGAGDGPAAASLDPRPVAFTDHARAIQRSPLALYQVISQGLSGTAMPSFAGLPAQQRWDLAFYVGSLSADDALRTRGQQLWGANAAARAAVPDLASLAQSREGDLALRLGADSARAITAYLRANPGAVAQAPPPRASSSGPTLAVARQRLAEAVDSYDPAQPAQAAQRALSAYLDGIEPIEPTLATRDPALLREIEAAMSQLRARIQARAPVRDVRAQADAVRDVFDRIEVALADKTTSSAAAFAGSFTILVREGLEALLIVVGMLAFLRKAQRADAIRYVHAGWVGALLAGGVTWAAATYLVGISGANREVTEGLSSLFAALVLLSVGIWMHGKSAAGRWQQYLSERMSAVLTGRSAIFLFGLSFIAVYREVFETILFYAAMWTPQDSTAIVGGLAAGIGLLAVIAWALLRAGMRLPVGTFFSVSAVLIAILAVVLAGKGTAALQEAGWISQTVLHAPRVDWLGVYPTVQSLGAQLAVAVIAGLGYLWAARVPHAPGKGR